MDTHPHDAPALADAIEATVSASQTLDLLESNERPALPRVLRRFFIHRHFALLWSGQTVSTFGSHITGMGLPIAALLLLHATPAQMGLLTALGALPGFVLGLVIGVWVDRLPRRPILIAADLGRALLLALIPLAAVLGLLHLVEFYVVAGLVGLLTVCFEVASLAFLPTLLTPEKLAIGNSRLATSDSLAEIAGPPLAGLLIQVLSAPLAIILDVLSFLFSACCLSRIRVPEPPNPTADQHSHLWRELCEGLVVLARHPLLRSLAIFIGVRNFFSGTFAVLYLIYVLHLFGNNPLAYSILVACGGLGALAGSFGANWCVRRFGVGRTLLGSALLSGVLCFTTPLAVGPIWFVFALLALSQLIGDSGFAVYAISEISLRQQLVPARLLGRVNACMHILSTGIVPLGALLAGALSEVIGIRLTLLLGCSGIGLVCAWLLCSPLRHYR